MGVLYLLGYLCSLKSFGIGFMEPLTPYRFKDWKDSIIVLPKSLLKGRPNISIHHQPLPKERGVRKMENDKLLPVQIMPIVSSTMMGVSILTIQRSLSSIAKGDAWISMILGVILGVFSAIFLYNLLRLNPGLDLAEIIVCQAGTGSDGFFFCPLQFIFSLTSDCH